MTQKELKDKIDELNNYSDNMRYTLQGSTIVRKRVVGRKVVVDKLSVEMFLHDYRQVR